MEILPWKPPCIFPGGRFQSPLGPRGGIPPGWNFFNKKIQKKNSFEHVFSKVFVQPHCVNSVISLFGLRHCDACISLYFYEILSENC